MAKSKTAPATADTDQSVPSDRYDMRTLSARPTKVEKPKRKTKRVYRVKGGLVSLLHTPAELVAT
jgi:hypothetical protein